MARVKSKIYKGRYGTPTGLLNRDHHEILVGDYIKLKDTIYDGPVLWHPVFGCYGVCFGLWHGDQIYDYRSYGKFSRIPDDQGMRMELLSITPAEAEYDRETLQHLNLR